MTPRQYVNRLRQLSRELAEVGPRVAEAMALEGKDVVQHRIQEVSGVTGATYRRFTAKRKTSRGHVANRVTLTDTGRMWAGIFPAPPRREGTAWVSGFSTRDSDTDYKVRKNIKRYGQFLRPLPDEIPRITQAGIDQIDNLLNKYL